MKENIVSRPICTGLEGSSPFKNGLRGSGKIV